MRALKSWLRCCLALWAALALGACDMVGTGTAMSGLKLYDAAGLPAYGSLHECQSAQLAAVAAFSGDGETTYSGFNNRVQWSSSEPDVLYVGDGVTPGPDGVVLAAGYAVGLRSGYATVTATYESFTATIGVEVMPLHALRITPALSDVGEYTQQQFAVEAQFAAGRAWTDVSGAAAWQLTHPSDAASVGLLSGLLSASGAQPAQSAQPLQLRATLAGCGRSADAAVRVSPVQGLEFGYEAGADTLMPLGLSERVHVYAGFATPGSTQQEVSGQVFIHGYNDSLLSIAQANDGLVVGAVGEGSSSFIAELDAAGLSAGSKTWQVEALDLEALTLSPAFQQLQFPDSGQVYATGLYEGGVQWPLTRVVQWSSNSDELEVESGGALAGLLTPQNLSQTATVTAQISDAEGQPLAADATVTVRAYAGD